MIILSLTDIHFSIGSTTILSGASLEVQSGERVALVGVNGAGKTTLLQIAAGQREFDSGSRSLRKDIRIGFVTQERTALHDRTVWEEAREVFAHVDELERNLLDLTHQLSRSQRGDLPTALIEAYEDAERAFTDAGGYGIDAQVRRVLTGLQFGRQWYDTPLKHLSGGQRTRLQLAKLLLSAPDLLILDEPTNYLDMATAEWLEDFLDGYAGALLIVSHDRYFLDRTTAATYELASGKTIRYPGNYSVFMEARKLADTQQRDAFERQQETIAKMEDFIARNIVRASTTKRAQSRRKALDKLERIAPLQSNRTSSLDFPITSTSGREVLHLDGLSVSFAGRALFNPISLHVMRGEHIALLGKNGAGKTSLLRALTGLIPSAGSIRWGTNVQLAYFSQEQETLHPHLTVLEELWQAHPSRSETDIRTRLGQLLFSGDDVFKSVASLSGGERSRLALAKISFSEANLLLLDEPTNHLDIATKEVLEEALLNYSGTILFVSHDRYFINRIATRVIELSETELLTCDGDYDDFLLFRKDRAVIAIAPVKDDIPNTGEQERQRRKQWKAAAKQRKDRLDRLEQSILTAETRKQELEEVLSRAETYENFDLATALPAEYTALQTQLQLLYEEWTDLAESTEATEDED